MSNKRSVRLLGLFGLLTSAALVGAGQVKLDGAKALVGGSQEGAVVKPKTVPLPHALTTVSLTNGTGQRQCIYITLTPPSYKLHPTFDPSLEVSNLNQVILTCTVTGGTDEGIVHSCNPNDGGDPDKAVQGFFYLNAGNTANYAPTLTFSANFYVNGNSGQNTDGLLPKNGTCITNADVQGPGIGVTMAEVTLNVPTDGLILGDEAVDISEVNGVNAIWEISLPLPALPLNPPNDNYPQYFSTAGYWGGTPGATHDDGVKTQTTWGDFGYQQLIPVPLISNNPGDAYPFSGDSTAELQWGIGLGNVGVYPFGCDNCDSRALPGCTDQTNSYPLAINVQMPTKICTLFRDKTYQWGGNVGITLVKFPFPAQTFAVHDVNTDGVTNSADLGHMLAVWGECSSTPCVGDINSDTVVDVQDLGLLLVHFVD